MRQQRFAPTTFFIWGGLLVYALDFLCVYVFVAVACARRFEQARWLDLPLVPLFTTASGAIAAMAIGAIMWRALRRNREDRLADESTRFIRFLAIAGGALALIALVWLTLPPLLLSNGCGQRY